MGPGGAEAPAPPGAAPQPGPSAASAMVTGTNSPAASAMPTGTGPPPASAAFPPAVGRTIDWLQDRYAAWYAANPPPMPDRFTRREFGYILWPERPGPPPFVRHRAYDEAGRFHQYLARAGPHSVYYSTAYYRRPGEMKMADKQWLGAELIFDLDADHLAEVEKAKAEGREMSLAEQLQQVKLQFMRLLDRFLFGHFGLSEKDVWITFSGGRGYHAHVVEDRLMQLDAKGRREVVDYITGKFPVKPGTSEMDLDWLLTKEMVGTKGRGQWAKGQYRLQVPASTTPGWSGDVMRALLTQLDERVLRVSPSEAKRWLCTLPGIGDKRAEEFIRTFGPERLQALSHGFEERYGRLYWSDLEAHGRRDAGALGGLGSALSHVVSHLIPTLAVELEGETDEPVTADTKRLIRLPGSLHGKSGLKVVTLRRDELDGFEPLRDAVAFGMDPVRIVPRGDQEMTLGGERVAVRKGEATDVPEAHAVFWCARQAGTIQPKGQKE